MYYRMALDGHKFYELARDGNRELAAGRDGGDAVAPGVRAPRCSYGRADRLYTLHALTFDTRDPDGDDYGRCRAALRSCRDRGPAQRHGSRSPSCAGGRGLPDPACGTKQNDHVRRSPTKSKRSRGLRRRAEAIRSDASMRPSSGHDRRVGGDQRDGGAARLPYPSDRLPGRRDQRYPAAFRRAQDTSTCVCVNPRAKSPGEVKILIDFRDPDIVGKFVYHCHI